MIRSAAFLLVPFSVFAQSVPSIQVRFTDVAGAAIVASASVLQSRDGTQVYHGEADSTGALRTPELEPAAYRLIAHAPGFRRLELTGLQVEAHTVLDLGARVMEFAGCDAPGVHCSPIGTPEHPPDLRAELGDYRGSVRLNRQCGVDIDTAAKMTCPVPAGIHAGSIETGIDLQLTGEQGSLYLVAVNGAVFSTPNASDATCGNARFTLSRILVEGPVRGIDFCTRSVEGAVAHVFLTEDVVRGSESVALWIVTRKR
ncbi:carboxypeptidase-like regulatory domain-containing protein [Paludibaculum fermentans]|uniref:carboxypeptidase-like regulatory domain-containing protein n=1 Tax=Paludibaculum fermentans TaxID=1473598 RepID=UPI003EC055E2